MPIAVSYQLYDVFTDTPFTGNPLAVSIDPPELSEEQCQTVARELNLSETVFVWPGRAGAADAGIPTRIFTPAAELPFAGHPTVGAALALVDAGAASGSVTLAEPVGPVEVSIVDGVATLTTAGPPRSMPTADPEDVVRSLGLTLADLHPVLGPRGWSAGVPFTIVALRDVDTLGRIELDVGWWRDTVALVEPDQLFAVAPDGASDGRDVDGSRWRARMFAPGLGIGEDPATGSAAAALCGYLAGHVSSRRLAEGWTVEQGVEMGRPSQIRVGAVRRGAELVAAQVGGRAVHVGHGELHL